MKKQQPEVFYKKGALKNFVKFSGKHLCQTPFLIKLQASQNGQTHSNNFSAVADKLFECVWPFYAACNFIKKEALA